jgi:hypothetical protein
LAATIGGWAASQAAPAQLAKVKRRGVIRAVESFRPGCLDAWMYAHPLAAVRSAVRTMAIIPLFPKCKPSSR